MTENMEKISFTHADMQLEYIKTEKGLYHAVFNPEKGIRNFYEPMPFPNFQLAIAGKPFGFCPAHTTGYTSFPLEMKMVRMESNEEKIYFAYRHDQLKIGVSVEMYLVPGEAVIRQFTTIVNKGNESVTLTHLSSMCMQGIATDGLRPWHDKKKIRVHYCRQTWEGEGQWYSSDLEELGLYPTSVHPCAPAIHFSSVGSNSTARFLPMAVLEDMETGKVWYFQIETSSSWHFEIGYRGSTKEGKGALYIHADGADERFCGWSKILQPGECFISVPVAVGCCKGNFNDAIKELTKYRRKVLKPDNVWKGHCPVIFNDYMNCLWANPTEEKLMPLINTASEVGAECFCIDAGWYTELKDSWTFFGLGDWEASKDRFGKGGLKGILDYIRSKNMIPGVWMEMEVCGKEAEIAYKPDSWFLMRNGKRIGGEDRWFLNFANMEVREYIINKIDKLFDMGVRYIKNDYNSCIGNGDDVIGSSAADGLDKHMRAFYSFIDEVREKHPRLILENCAGGAMRQDYGILSHFHLQSSSDQEIYYNYPSILTGSLAGVLPEQLGIWTYPYPLLFKDLNQSDILIDDNYQKSMSDGEQTVS